VTRPFPFLPLHQVKHEPQGASFLHHFIEAMADGDSLVCDQGSVIAAGNRLGGVVITFPAAKG
jgi:hypothetical protein